MMVTRSFGLGGGLSVDVYVRRMDMRKKLLFPRVEGAVLFLGATIFGEGSFGFRGSSFLPNTSKSH